MFALALEAVFAVFFIENVCLVVDDYVNECG